MPKIATDTRTTHPASRAGALATGYIVFLLAAFPCISAKAADEPTSKEGIDFFEKKIRPIFADNCYACHSADTKPAGGLRVDDRNGLLTGGNNGRAVVPGKPEESLLLKRVGQSQGKRQMPLEGKRLSDEQIADLSRWIKGGAAWPAIRVPASLGKAKPEYEQLKKQHWAWQALTSPKAPAVRDATWSKTDIDRFILAGLEANNLKPVGDADKVTLIRRVTFDLIGLPPTPAEIDHFLQDLSQGAFEKVVDRLLASSQFGEHWGRHWLDVARYGESTGPSRNIPYPHAWKYRDYVIDAIKADVPFDRFVIEQIAGDLLPASKPSERDRLLTATGFLALGVKDVNQRFKVRFVMDNVDEQIDVVARSLLALTVSCARCHDHKFDPIPTTDYYALAGIFTSTDNCAGLRNKMGGGGLDYYDPSMLVRLSSDVAPPPTEQVAKLQAAVAEAKKEWEAIRGTPEGLTRAPNGFPTQRPYRLKLERLQSELLELTDPAVRGKAVHGVRDAAAVGDTEIRIRGEAEKLGPVVPRGFLTAFSVPDAPKIDPKQSGRLELAYWLTNPKNPLTARVAANRVWQHLFGRGIVKTVDNFGVTGDTPSHPELLDHLTARFINDGWSIKKLVRNVVLTRAYQLGSEAAPDHLAADPSNRLVWRHSPRRLSTEEIRDATLAAAGTLDANRPAGSPAQALKMIEMRDNGPEAGAIRAKADGSTHRSIYLPLLRGVIPQSLEAFDPADSTLVSGNRETTTVPAQSLYLLNSPFVRKQSLALAERLLSEKAAADSARIQNAYRLLLGRKAAEKELERALAFLADYESSHRSLAVTGPKASTAPKKIVAPKKSAEPPFDPDQIDQSGEPIVEEAVKPNDSRTAAWLAFAQALIGSGEFRYLR
jgi:mono/diheme cytochrome c family protein